MQKAIASIISAAALLGAALSLFAQGAPNPWDGTIFPPANPPDFVKAQWEKIAKQTWLPYEKWTWAKVGLPAGLEEQVWKAWAPDAKPVWQNVAPGYANVVYDAKIDNGVVTLILDGAGLVQSKDGGRSWKALSHHLTSPAYGYFAFDISPANPDIIVVAGGYLDRSLDGGRSWSFIYDKELPPYGYEDKSSFGAVRFNADGSKLFCGLGAFGHMQEPRSDIEPTMEKRIGRKIVYVADPNAANFKKIDLGSFAAIRTILPDPRNPETVFASFSDGSIYVCRNAKAETPEFVKLELPESLNGFQAISMDLKPGSGDELLMAMIARDSKRDSKLVSGKLSGSKLDCQELALTDKNGKSVRPYGIIASARWNPRKPSQAFAGFQGPNIMLASDDSLKSFRQIHFPKDLQHDEPGAGKATFYSDPHKLCFDPKSDLAVTWSCIGAWSSRDQFKSLQNLTMTYDSSKKLYGNKGVGFAECAVSLAIRKGAAYMATNDHGLFRSDGQDFTKWQRISKNPGMPKREDGRDWTGLFFPMGVSMDEKYIYAFARMGWPENNPYSNKKLKLMLSTDKGDSWQDVTARLGKGETLEIDQAPQQILFDPTDSSRQWILMRKSFFRSIDGGKSFQEGDPATFKDKLTLSMAYDPLHKILYAIAGTSMVQSKDFGLTWSPFKLEGLEPNRIIAVGVLKDGSLVLGSEGRLIVVPYGKIAAGKLEPSMVRMTVGDSLGAFAAAQRDFHSIYCDGDDILVFPNNGFRFNSSTRLLGPLLSRDGGKSFQWIVYDLPCEEGGNAEIRDGKIMIGTRGTYLWKYK